MKIIYPNAIANISASGADPEFPASNLLDEHPKKIWKGIGRSETLTIACGASGALGLFKTNAESVTVTIFIGQDIEWVGGIEWAGGIEWDEQDDAPSSTTYQLSGVNEGAGWIEWEKINASNTIQLVLDAGEGNIIEAGVCVAGVVNSYDEPEYGLTDGFVDYSIVKELNNGAFYIRKRDVVRKFNGILNFKHALDFYKFMLDVLRPQSQLPFAVHLNGALANWEWIIYGRFTSVSSSYDGPNQTTVNFELLEVL